ncbi:hypothetical protein [Streptomyces sp. NBC_01233]|uniref:hypothetical protein n=1 Tax=Streptomyces sp. NBC_01233 TaxID=2903787 RepID=UPI002E13EBE7|nr:hypothetical protein OG332_39435 [Streptomyces sp. NBC_01233]
MAACSTARASAGPGRVRTVACAALLLALATGCRNDAAPAWGYPDLGATVRSLSRALGEGCAGKAPANCSDDLDRLDALAERAFSEVLDHRLLDDAYVAAWNEVRRTRQLRLAAAAQARSRRDPHHPPLARAVAAEELAYRHLLAALERVRTAPPAGDGTDPV